MSAIVLQVTAQPLGHSSVADRGHRVLGERMALGSNPLPRCERSSQGSASELRRLGGRIAGGAGSSPSFRAAGACYRARLLQRLPPCPWCLLQEQPLQNIWMSLRAWAWLRLC